MSSNLVAAEIRYQQSTCAIDLLVKDEEIRRSRLGQLLLGDDIDRLNEQILDEAGRGDAAEAQVANWREEAEDTSDRLERTLNELRARTRELETLKAELLALHDSSAESTKLLTEKLSLSREISTLKPELEHLRSQASTNEGILAEKLSLQGQLDAAQAELENEKRNLKRALRKQGTSSQQDAEREEEIMQLQAELANEKRQRQKAEKSLVKANEDEVDALRKELAKEKKMREVTERNADNAADSQLKELRKELAKEKKQREKWESEAQDDKAQLEQFKKDWDSEKDSRSSAQDTGAKEVEKLKKEIAKLRSEQEKESRASAKAFDEQVEELKRDLARERDEREAISEKLTLFREKLRTTKDKLKHSDAELAKAQQAAQIVSPHVAAIKTLENPRKRPAVQFDPDAAIATPGDGPAAKRSKRASSAVVEKSTFSITPFLNRTTSVAPGSPPKDNDDNDQDQPIASIEAASPTAVKSQVKKPSTTVLAPTSTNKTITKASAVGGNRKKAAVPSISLKTVTEENSDDDENNNDKEAELSQHVEEPQQKRTTSQPALKAKPVLKPRKSLASFASFRDGSLPPQPLIVQNKKKRKLHGNAFGAKTIFDEDEDDNAASLPMAGARVVSVGGQRAFGAIGGGAFGKLAGGWGSTKLGGKAKGPLMVTGDGLMFSPLKKDRRAMAAAGGG